MSDVSGLYEAGERRSERWKRWALMFCGWTAVGLFFSVRISLVYARGGARLLAPFSEPRWWLLARSIFPWYLWGLFSVPIFRLVDRFPMRLRFEAARAALHVSCGVLFVLVHSILSASFSFWLDPAPRRYLEALQTEMLISGPWDIATYTILVLFAHAAESNRRLSDREVRASRLEARLAQAELELLRSQLDPHFLFNSLHAISALLREDAAAADRMLQSLSRLLRQSMETAGRQEVPLRVEFDFLRRYLEIQQIRFGQRLAVTLDLEEGLEDRLVPNFFLQPLVENAIRHGISRRSRPGRIDVRARRVPRGIEITVRDDGEGLPRGPLKTGVGLSNTRARLSQMYGSDHVFSLESAEGGGVLVTIRVPLRQKIEGRSDEDSDRRRRGSGTPADPFAAGAGD